MNVQTSGTSGRLHQSESFLHIVLDEYYESQWFQKVNQERAISGQCRNKLRTYRQHKTEFKAEDYLIKVMNRKHRKFRAGVAPIRLETGRYEGLEVDDCIYAQYVKVKLKQKNMSLPEVHLTVVPEIFYIMHVLNYVMILIVLQTLKSFVLY